MRSEDIIPILISILVIILVAVLQNYSKLIAAITATMPLTAPLALWIVYSLNDGDKKAIEQLTEGMVIGTIPTMAFLVAIWLAARSGLKLVPIMLSGYGVWAVVLVLSLGLRKILGS